MNVISIKDVRMLRIYKQGCRVESPQPLTAIYNHPEFPNMLGLSDAIELFLERGNSNLAEFIGAKIYFPKTTIIRGNILYPTKFGDSPKKVAFFPYVYFNHSTGCWDFGERVVEPQPHFIGINDLFAVQVS